ncbi:MAG: hypothetical protein WC735_03690 [Candidatus Paceibacterota bacterium]|jgi:hypothetical protein
MPNKLLVGFANINGQIQASRGALDCTQAAHPAATIVAMSDNNNPVRRFGSTA